MVNEPVFPSSILASMTPAGRDENGGGIRGFARLALGGGKCYAAVECVRVFVHVVVVLFV